MLYEISGNQDSSAILMFPGSFGSARSMQGYIDLLKENYYVIAVTLDGCDGSGNSYTSKDACRGPVLLISTEADTVWPSAEQAAYIERYLSMHDFSYEVKNLTYKNVSHFAIPMRRNAWLLKLMFRSERQSPEECAAERADLSEQAVDFIQNHWQ
jgi:hypothetical protein